MTARREPFLPLFVGDFLASTGEWTGEEQGLYLLLLAHQWAVGSLPPEQDKLVRLSRWDRRAFARCWVTVGGKFTERDGRLYNLRLEEHRAHANTIANKRAEAGSKGGSKRAANAKQMPSKCQANASVLLNHQSINQEEDSEAKASGAPAPSQSVEQETPASLDQALFSEGRKVFGKSSGGLLNQAIRAKGKPWLVQMIETCRSKDSEAARAYLSAAMTEREQRANRFNTA